VLISLIVATNRLRKNPFLSGNRLVWHLPTIYVLELVWRDLVVLGSYPRGLLWYNYIGVNDGTGHVESSTVLKLYAAYRML
jgi:hypothetical protein